LGCGEAGWTGWWRALPKGRSLEMVARPAGWRPTTDGSRRSAWIPSWRQPRAVLGGESRPDAAGLRHWSTAPPQVAAQLEIGLGAFRPGRTCLLLLSPIAQPGDGPRARRLVNAARTCGHPRCGGRPGSSPQLTSRTRLHPVSRCPTGPATSTSSSAAPALFQRSDYVDRVRRPRTPPTPPPTLLRDPVTARHHLPPPLGPTSALIQLRTWLSSSPIPSIRPPCPPPPKASSPASAAGRNRGRRRVANNSLIAFVRRGWLPLMTIR